MVLKLATMTQVHAVMIAFRTKQTFVFASRVSASGANRVPKFELPLLALCQHAAAHLANVRYWHIADIDLCAAHVCF